ADEPESTCRLVHAVGVGNLPRGEAERRHDAPNPRMRVTKPSRSRSASAATTDCLQHIANCASPSRLGTTRPYFSVKYSSAPNTDSAVRVMMPRCLLSRSLIQLDAILSSGRLISSSSWIPGLISDDARRKNIRAFAFLDRRRAAAPSRTFP